MIANESAVIAPPGLPKVVDAMELDDELRSLLRPDELVVAEDGSRHRLPRFFFEVASHEAAKRVRLSPHFGLNELIRVDLREAERLQQWPRYVPCAVRLLGFALERLREALGQPLRVTANGGYRSPAHQLAKGATAHMWGTAADLYRVGGTLLKDKESIEKTNGAAAELSPLFRTKPFGSGAGEVDDHVHVDLGYLLLTPSGCDESPRERDEEAKPPERRHEDRRKGGSAEAGTE